jgi:hypothetical protein
MKALYTTMLALLCASAYSQQGLSPKLSQFLLEHPSALSALSNALWEAQLSRPVHVYYFYANQQAHLPAMHRYLDGASTLGVFVQENQPACDEGIDILFEVLNSKGEKRFKELWDKAESRAISKEDYVKEILREEFKAVVATRKVIVNFNLSEKEVAGSQNYKWFMESPTDFEKFLVHRKQAGHAQGDNYYREQYDKIRGNLK